MRKPRLALGQFDLIGIVELRDNFARSEERYRDVAVAEPRDANWTAAGRPRAKPRGEPQGWGEHNLSDLKKVLRILGPYWWVVYSDMIPDTGGNRERIAFVYDQRAVTFTGFAATATPPRTKKGTEYLSDRSWWRPPYAASFQAGNFDFVVIAAHIRWGDSKKARLAELELFAEWVTAKRKEPTAVDKDILVMGDFNLEDEEMFKVLTGYGLKVPDTLIGRDLGTNLERNKRYDQILHVPQYPANFTNAGDVLDFYTGGIKPLFPDMKDKDKLAFTFQMSDHRPLWVQINTDIDNFVLEQISKGYGKEKK